MGRARRLLKEKTGRMSDSARSLFQQPAREGQCDCHRGLGERQGSGGLLPTPLAWVNPMPFRRLGTQSIRAAVETGKLESTSGTTRSVPLSPSCARPGTRLSCEEAHLGAFDGHVVISCDGA